MTTEIKVRKIGNSLGIVLPKETLTRMKVQEGDVLTVTEAAENALHITPYSDEVSKQMEVVEDVMKRYRNTLRELAK